MSQKVPPFNLPVIGLFSILFSLLSFLLSSFFLPKKLSYVVATGVLLFLLIDYLIGFQIINTLLLFSFMLGIAFLLK